MSNAFKFTPEEGRIQVFLRTIGAERDQVAIEVKDSGIGIPKEQQGSVFERFYPVNSSEATQQPIGTGIALTEVEISSLDEALMRKAISYIETQIGSPELTVERLSWEMGMSRVNFYKKCLSITGKSPVELIRVIRLKRAAQLLEKSQLRVGEVALECGFNDVKLFRKYFKEEFGVPPSDYPRA